MLEIPRNAILSISDHLLLDAVAGSFNDPVCNHEIEVTPDGPTVSAIEGKTYTPDEFFADHEWVLEHPEKYWAPQPVVYLQPREPIIPTDPTAPCTFLSYRTFEHFPNTHNGIAPIRLYKKEDSQGDQSKTILIYSPGWGGGNTDYRERLLYGLAHTHGVDAMLTELPLQGTRTPKTDNADIANNRSGAYYISINIINTLNNFKQVVAENLALAEYAKKNMGYQNVVLLGESGGGLACHNAYIVANGLIDGYIPFKTGVDLAHLFFTSQFTQWSRNFLHLAGITEVDLDKFWRIGDLESFANRINDITTPVAPIVTNGDYAIPTSSQRRMCELLSPNTTNITELDGGHALSILLHQKKVEKHIVEFVKAIE